MSQSSLTPENREKPFLVEIRQERPQRNGSFIPAASLKITESFRTSGLLHALEADELKNLVYLLTFLTPEGNCTVSSPILASGMKVSTHQAKARMHRLAKRRFLENAIITEVAHENGLFTYSLHPRWVGYEHLTVSPPHPTSPVRVSSRSTVVAHSRQQYARPRAEVEKMVAEQLGYDTTETEEQKKLRVRLENAGLNSQQAKEVIAAHPADTIAQQLDWLPYRHAKNPAGYLLAAIEGRYQEPKAIRDQRFVLEEKHGAGTTMKNGFQDEDEFPDVTLGVDEPELPDDEPTDSLPSLEIGEAVLSLPEE